MTTMPSRWPVLLVQPVRRGDVDREGYLTAEGCERLFDLGRSAYFDLVTTFRPEDVEVLDLAPPRLGVPVGDEASISVSVVEVFPDRFTMEARVRPASGDEVAADLVCTVTVGEVTREIRDELIGLAHSATHWH